MIPKTGILAKTADCPLSKLQPAGAMTSLTNTPHLSHTPKFHAADPDDGQNLHSVDRI